MFVRDCALAPPGSSSPPAVALSAAPLGTVATVFADASVVAAPELEGTSGGAAAVAGWADLFCLLAFDFFELLADLPLSLGLAPFSSAAFPLSLPTGTMLFDCV